MVQYSFPENKYKNDIQIENNHLANEMGFGFPETAAYALASEVGELIDIVLKMEGKKKIKSTDDVSDLRRKLSDEIADVLVYLGQVATRYGICIEEAFMNKVEVIRQRKFK